jgi:nicotinamidase-related amidase
MSVGDRIEGKSSALVLNDLQVAIISGSPLASSDPDALSRMNAAVDRCAEALDAARRTDVLVVHVRVAFSPGYQEANPHSPMMRFMREKGVLIEGHAGTAFDPRVAPRPGEIVVTKHTVSAFAGTPLDQILRARGVGTIVVGGLVTHYAVDGSARDAHDRGYRVMVLKDGCASATPARHDASLANLAFLAEVVMTRDFVSRVNAPSSLGA